ncbi:isochorismatase family protein [Paenibacillus sp. FSL R7-0345]|uniref:cysteine hydrolase family protein n=1 Tax=Paenibacillus sp. FSL R7-0345 TaxID=2954535 RepID=UPI00315B1762
MKLGYLIIDMQEIHVRDYVDQKTLDRGCEYMNYVADMLREKDQLVIHIQDIEGIEEDTKERYNIIPEIRVADSDLKVTKEHSNAFWKTELEQLLKEHGVELLIISGFSAEHCVQFTYNGASERGFRPVLLQNGVLSAHSDTVTAAHRDRNLISYPVIPYLINQ